MTLVVDEPRGALPPFTVESPWWMESGPVVEAARQQLGLDIVVVRLLDGDRFPGGPVTYLAEVDAMDPAADLEPWPGALGPDPRRPVYAEIGGVAELTNWATIALEADGIESIGPVEQVRTWNLSCLLRLPTNEGRFWLKAVPDFFSHEATVVSTLAEIDPTLVPELIAARSGAMLMRPAGSLDGYDVGPDRHFAAVRRLGAATRDLERAGFDRLVDVPRFGPADCVRALEDLADRHGADLSGDEGGRLTTLVDETSDRWRRSGLDDRLVHGDLHGGNLRLAEAEDFDVIIDWGDASITHPLFELSVIDSYTPGWPAETTDRWLELLGADHDGWSAFRPLAAIRPAILYRRFCDRIETSELPYHEPDILPALRRGLALL